MHAPSQAVGGRDYYVWPDVSMSGANIGIFSLYTNTEQISTKFAGGNHHHQQMNLIHSGEILPGKRETSDLYEGHKRKVD